MGLRLRLCFDLCITGYSGEFLEGKFIRGSDLGAILIHLDMWNSCRLRDRAKLPAYSRTPQISSSRKTNGGYGLNPRTTPAFAVVGTSVMYGLFASMLPGSREAAFFRDMVIAGTAIADPEDSRAAASLWHG